MSRTFKIDLEKEYKKFQKVLKRSLWGTVAFLMGSMAITTFHLFPKLNLNLFGIFINLTLPVSINFFVDLQFCAVILSLRQRFKWLNDKTRKVFELQADFVNKFSKNSENRPLTHVCVLTKLIMFFIKFYIFDFRVSEGFFQDRTIKFLEIVRMKHYELCNLSQKWNSAYSLQLLLLILQNLITFIIGLYYTGMHLIYVNKISVFYLLYAVMHLTITLIQLLALVLSCSKTTKEVSFLLLILLKIK